MISLDPKNVAAKSQLDATQKLVRRLAFESAIKGKEEEAPSVTVRLTLPAASPPCARCDVLTSHSLRAATEAARRRRVPHPVRLRRSTPRGRRSPDLGLCRRHDRVLQGGQAPAQAHRVADPDRRLQRPQGGGDARRRADSRGSDGRRVRPRPRPRPPSSRSPGADPRLLTATASATSTASSTTSCTC